MSLQGQTAVGTAQEVLEALQVCAGRGAARPVCALAAASFCAATLLGMTCAEAARLGPRQSLQVLLMKGPSAAPVCLHRWLSGWYPLTGTLVNDGCPFGSVPDMAQP